MVSAVRAFALSAGLWLAPGCGGSSSETPFPLEPDTRSSEDRAPNRYVVVANGQRAGEPAPAQEPTDEAEPPAPSTWGTPAVAPAEADPVPDMPLRD
jgi:hypothetical protein